VGGLFLRFGRLGRKAATADRVEHSRLRPVRAIATEMMTPFQLHQYQREGDPDER
jgi:hypothetical protein